MQNEKWVLCPVCGNKTRIKIRENTVLLNFPFLSEVQAGTAYKCSAIKSNYHQRARRTDAEPMNL